MRLIGLIVAAMVIAAVPANALPADWQAGAHERALSPQGVRPEQSIPPYASGIRGANDVGLGVDLIVVNAQEQPQNRFWFGREIRFLFESGPGPASVYIFGIGTGGEVLYASSSHSAVPPGIKRYPPDALLYGEHGPITASPPIGVSTFQIVVSRRPLEVLDWQRWIAPPDQPPASVRALIMIIQALPLKYGTENVGFDFVQFCAEPTGGNFSGCPLGPPETLRPPAPPVRPPAPCPGQSLAQYDTYGEGRPRIIDDPEILGIIDAWVSGQLCDALVLLAVDLWIQQRPIPVGLGVAGPPALFLQVRQGLVTLLVQGASWLEAAVYDMAGRLVWQDRAFGSRLAWRQLASDGRRLANGVYLAVITAQVNGQPQRWTRKIAVLR